MKKLKNDQTVTTRRESPIVVFAIVTALGLLVGLSISISDGERAMFASVPDDTLEALMHELKTWD